MKMKALLAFSIFVAFAIFLVDAFSSEDKAFFREWMKKYNKSYRTHAEEKEAMENVLFHKEKCEEHNKLYEHGKASYERGLNEHSDLSSQQMKRYLGGMKYPRDDNNKRTKRLSSGFGSTAEIPDYPKGPKSIDWREYGLVGPASSQGGCGSCWAFSATTIIEAAIRKINKKKKVHVSPQQLVDCSHHETYGCSGGLPPFALDYVRKNGIASDDEYPYYGYERTCEYNKTQSVANIKDVFNVPTNGNETWMMNVVGKVGPVSVDICFHDSLHHYKGDIYDQADCCAHNSDRHAPVVVGYGTDKKHGDYWIIKNSWGTSWGNNGFGKFRQGKNTCNIGVYAVYATAE